ncbi:hypothetical protein BD779DRAFT_1803450 [Infundibulicybe gibba]|nr:hypothetical protein BD779DRAFT_1803450 [Infundibulicybe gibba]
MKSKTKKTTRPRGRPRLNPPHADISDSETLLAAPTSAPSALSKKTYDPIHILHFDELAAIWAADRRIPTPESRRAWALARNLNPVNVNSWWYRRKTVARKGKIRIPKDTYELEVGSPPTLPAVIKEELAAENRCQTDDVEPDALPVWPSSPGNTVVPTSPVAEPKLCAYVSPIPSPGLIISIPSPMTPPLLSSSPPTTPFEAHQPPTTTEMEPGPPEVDSEAEFCTQDPTKSGFICALCRYDIGNGFRIPS